MTTDRDPAGEPQEPHPNPPPNVDDQGRATSPDTGHETGGGHDGMGPGPTGS